MNRNRFNLLILVVILTTLGLAACGGPTIEKVDGNESQALAEAVETSLGQTEPGQDQPGFADSLAALEADQDFVGQVQPGSKDDSGQEIFPAIDWALRDQTGLRHALKQYEGKVVVLNFWQTWCPPCLAELPDFQKVYEQYGKNQEDVIILGVASPNNELNKVYTQEGKTDAEIGQFLADQGVEYPCLMDYQADLYQKSGIMSFPTTYFIDAKGMIYGYAPGGLSEANLIKLIEEVKESTK